jgi:RimJ/RimL family protein N-acetyltransferase
MSKLNNHFTLREVSETDKILLFNWTNDQEVRKWSFEKDPISLNEHEVWFEKKLIASNVLIWIFEDHNSPVGMVRLEREDNNVYLNYLLATQSRGKGLASSMLKMSMLKVSTYWQNIKVFAYTLPANIASIKSLEKAGFTLESSSNKKNSYVYNIN